MWVFLATSIFGLLLGSFLNVVIYRGPAIWGLVGQDRGARGNIAAPRSRCPNCSAQIRVVDLIPVASFFALRGKCRACRAPISLRYPIVEAFAAAACIFAVLIFGFSLQSMIASIFLLGLIALAAIDVETGFLPEALTLPLIALGLGANAFAIFVDWRAALIGAAAGYGSFWAISAGYSRLRGREGLGLGDAALFAAIGAWAGWQALPAAALVASILGLGGVLASAAARGRKLKPEESLPFGPSLAAAGAFVFLAVAAAKAGYFPWLANYFPGNPTQS